MSTNSPVTNLAIAESATQTISSYRDRRNNLDYTAKQLTGIKHLSENPSTESDKQLQGYFNQQ